MIDSHPAGSGALWADMGMFLQHNHMYEGFRHTDNFQCECNPVPKICAWCKNHAPHHNCNGNPWSVK